MLNVAPLDYQRYAALYGLVPAPVEDLGGDKTRSRQAETVAPVSTEVNRRQTYYTRQQAKNSDFTLTENGNAKRQPVFISDQNPGDLSWLYEITSNDGNSGAGSGHPSARNVAALYTPPGETPTPAFHLQA